MAESVAETLTESFCERCGSRYTFESAAPKVRLRGLRVATRGLKTFVLDDKQSFSEAMAAARSDTDRDTTSSQLDAFHKTFNFCMQCRQYTCPNCWNEDEGRCLTCAPLASIEAPAAPWEVPALSGNGNGHVHDEPAGPFAAVVAAANGHSTEEGTGFDALARLDALTAPIAAPAVEPVKPEIVEPEIVEPAAEHMEPEPVAAAAVETVEPEIVVVEPEPVMVDEPEPVIAVQPEPVMVVEPVIDVVEPVIGDPPLAIEPVAAAAEPEPIALAEPEPIMAVEPEPTAVIDVAPVGVAEAEPALATEAERVIPVAESESAGDVVVSEALPEVIAERVAKSAEQTSRLFAGMRPGQSLAAAIEAYEESAQAAEPEPEPVAQAEPEPEPEAVVAAEPEPVAPEAPEPEPPVAAGPVVEPTPVPVDRIEQPTWSVVETPVIQPTQIITPVQPVAPPIQPVVAATASPEWPATPQWPAHEPSPGLPFLGRPAVPSGGIDALWAESDRAVTAQPTAGRAVAGVQPCVSCGLSLSATARFCRRCGSAQR